LAVAVSIAGVYSTWAPELSKQLGGEATDQAENTITCRNAGMDIRGAEYDITGEVAKVNISNTGTISLYNDVSVVVLNSSEVAGEETISELEVSETQLVEIRSEKIPEILVASSNQCPDLRTSTESIDVEQ